MARLILIDETSTNTRLTKRTGWPPKGERFRTHAPFGKWQTQTFIAGLRCHGLVAPWIVNAPMTMARFELYVETQLAPKLSPGDVVIHDNVALHKSKPAAELVRQRGAWMPALPAYLPDLNPVEMAFSNQGLAQKAHRPFLRRHLRSLKDICDMFDPIQAEVFFKAGYEGIKRNTLLDEESFNQFSIRNI